jgi:hypothetical protein
MPRARRQAPDGACRRARFDKLGAQGYSVHLKERDQPSGRSRS